MSGSIVPNKPSRRSTVLNRAQRDERGISATVPYKTLSTPCSSMLTCLRRMRGESLCKLPPRERSELRRIQTPRENSKISTFRRTI